MLRPRLPAPRALAWGACQPAARHGGRFIFAAATQASRKDPAGISSAHSAMPTQTSSSDIKSATLLLALRARCAESGRRGHVASACRGKA
eukprot:6095253-Pyramimonas_sp.AAC.1